MNDQVSVVMITQNRGEQIRTALLHLLELPERPPIILVDNDSCDNTIEIARAVNPQIKIMPLPKNLGGAARNVGVMQATTPYVAFSDDDSWWAAGALTRAADLFDSNRTLGLIAARIQVGPEEQIDPLSYAMENSSLTKYADRTSQGIPVVGFAACGSVVRRSAFLQAGGFPPNFGVGGEEQVLALDLLRKGWQLAYFEEVVAHHHPSTVRDVEKRKRYEVRNALWSAWLRRPLASAWNVTWRVLQSALKEEASRAGLLDAVRGVRWILDARNPIPVAIDRQLQAAEKEWMNMTGSS